MEEEKRRRRRRSHDDSDDYGVRLMVWLLLVKALWFVWGRKEKKREKKNSIHFPLFFYFSYFFQIYCTSYINTLFFCWLLSVSMNQSKSYKPSKYNCRNFCFAIIKILGGVL